MSEKWRQSLLMGLGQRVRETLAGCGRGEQEASYIHLVHRSQLMRRQDIVGRLQVGPGPQMRC